MEFHTRICKDGAGCTVAAHCFVAYPGQDRNPLAEGVDAISLIALAELLSA